MISDSSLQTSHAEDQTILASNRTPCNTGTLLRNSLLLQFAQVDGLVKEVEWMLSSPVLAVIYAMNTSSNADRANGKHSMFT